MAGLMYSISGGQDNCKSFHIYEFKMRRSRTELDSWK